MCVKYLLLAPAPSKETESSPSSVSGFELAQLARKCALKSIPPTRTVASAAVTYFTSASYYFKQLLRSYSYILGGVHWKEPILSLLPTPLCWIHGRCGVVP